MSKDLMAIHAITRKPKNKIEQVAPGEIFTPATEAEQEFLLRSKAARVLTEAEAKARGSKAPAKKAPAKKPEAAPADKTVPMDSDKPGAEDADKDILD